MPASALHSTRSHQQGSDQRRAAAAAPRCAWALAHQQALGGCCNDRGVEQDEVGVALVVAGLKGEGVGRRGWRGGVSTACAAFPAAASCQLPHVCNCPLRPAGAPPKPRPPLARQPGWQPPGLTECGPPHPLACTPRSARSRAHRWRPPWGSTPPAHAMQQRACWAQVPGGERRGAHSMCHIPRPAARVQLPHVSQPCMLHPAMPSLHRIFLHATGPTGVCSRSAAALAQSSTCRQCNGVAR